jgi:cytochrome c oxidase cbb3-type subunit 3
MAGKLKHGALCAGAALAALSLLAACKREERLFRARAPASGSVHTVRLSPLQPGEKQTEAKVKNDYEKNAYAISQGQKYFETFNCAGCHSHGGGGMGPALMDDKWRYGSEPDQIFATITEGRPNGMPSFRGHITDDQAWDLVSYVRSLSGLDDPNASPGREDHISGKQPENTRPRQDPRNSETPG